MKMQFKLGAILGAKDVKNIRLSNYLPPDLPEPRPLNDWITGKEKRLRMWANNVRGDCVFAAFYNILSVVSSWTDDPFSATDDDVLEDYHAVTGFDPKQDRPDGKNPTDKGANPEDALRFYSKKPKGHPHRIEAWGEVNRFNLKECRQALDIFGGLYTGIALPISARKQIGKVWTCVPGPTGIPGSLGGHMVAEQCIDGRKPIISGDVDTWAKRQKYTGPFMAKYCTARYFFITEKWISDHTGKTPGGLDLKTLLKDVQVLKEAGSGARNT